MNSLSRFAGEFCNELARDLLDLAQSGFALPQQTEARLPLARRRDALVGDMLALSQVTALQTADAAAPNARRPRMREAVLGALPQKGLALRSKESVCVGAARLKTLREQRLRPDDRYPIRGSPQ